MHTDWQVSESTLINRTEALAIRIFLFSLNVPYLDEEGQVTIDDIHAHFLNVIISEDCTVNNGGCGINADCTHDPTTHAVICKCENGYTNNGTSTSFVCIGKTTHIKKTSLFTNRFVADTCLIRNGDCDVNANCSHAETTNEVKCTCKTGYTNTGSVFNVTCTGTVLRTF